MIGSTFFVMLLDLLYGSLTVNSRMTFNDPGNPCFKIRIDENRNEIFISAEKIIGTASNDYE